jgi:hypothetical protein
MVAWNDMSGPSDDDCVHHPIGHPSIPDINCGAAVKLGMIAACHKAIATIDFSTMRGTRAQCRLPTGHYLDVDIKLIGPDELIVDDPNA